MCDLFIYPGFRFKMVDGLITNFHLPRSTLLMLVSAFAGRENVLQAYAEARLRRCPFQEGKIPCAECPVHCYEPGMRERIRAVMRYAGPRMLYRYPVLAVLHFLDGRRKEPLPKVRRKSGTG